MQLKRKIREYWYIFIICVIILSAPPFFPLPQMKKNFLYNNKCLLSSTKCQALCYALVGASAMVWKPRLLSCGPQGRKQGKGAFFFKINLFILLLAALGLRGCARAFSSCGEWGLLFVVVRGLLTAVASLVAEHGLQAQGLRQLWCVRSVVVARGLQSAGSVVVAHSLSCSAAGGIFLGQGSNPCPLHWQADS